MWRGVFVSSCDGCRGTTGGEAYENESDDQEQTMKLPKLGKGAPRENQASNADDGVSRETWDSVNMDTPIGAQAAQAADRKSVV